MGQPLLDANYNASSFPCGAVTDAYRVTCPPGAAQLEAGDFLVVTMTLAAPIETDDVWLQYGLAIDSDGDSSDNYFGIAPYDLDLFNDTEQWLRLEISPDGERHVWADGIRDGLPGFPRFSSAAAIEWGDTLMWIVPLAEVEGDQLAIRTTAFHQTEPPNVAPTPDNSGGDVSGFDVSTLIEVASDPAPSDLSADRPADVEGTSERGPQPTEPDLAVAEAMAAELESRLNAAFATREVEPVQALIHTISKASSPDRCRSLVETTFTGAVEIEISDVTLPTPNAQIVTYQAMVGVEYPTGTNAYAVVMAPDIDGRLTLMFDCS
jgi:hypothetical protein